MQVLSKFNKILKSKKCSKFKRKVNVAKSKKPKKELYVQAYDYYHGLPKINWANVDDDEVLAIRNYMIGRGFSIKTLNKCKARYTFNKFYPIVFPMLDNKKFKGWVCRTNDKEIEKKRKYLYNEGFSRASTLVGDYGEKNYVFVVEGYMDRLKFIQYGEENVVAILGWKMSNEQINKLKEKNITTIISALDNDECGKKGTEYLKKFFNVVRFCYLKGVKDPGEMSKLSFKKMHKKTIDKWRTK